ncbi:uncharacterized protein K460DRAFT_171526 [Cucurbitaria berberidis CBS 394.84]|uniref:Uncharacterized protein n=1 Tax=Cucurbitaria berberidis CBS 394.84 TaxID=1168544 RepID=A0A9P4GAI5_9PLEO|nr:uncharacterized protein K460DRAFT_171526 [Cucurbitaria berberidis CBS 394.84]KAF1841704.1 hypothetical protein K460DRAFT_171526 [Cucurbitaria berberidis CBS 394.84]
MWKTVCHTFATPSAVAISIPPQGCSFRAASADWTSAEKAMKKTEPPLDDKSPDQRRYFGKHAETKKQCRRSRVLGRFMPVMGNTAFTPNKVVLATKHKLLKSMCRLYALCSRNQE